MPRDWTFVSGGETSRFAILLDATNGITTTSVPEQQPIVIFEAYAGGGGGTTDYIADDPYVWEINVMVRPADVTKLRDMQRGRIGTLTSSDRMKTYTLALALVSLNEAVGLCQRPYTHTGTLRFQGFNT